MNSTDTIFALASAPGAAGVAVVRASGALVPAMLTALLGKLPAPRMATYGSLQHAGQVIDQAVTLYFKAPASYTGEEVAEFHVHGGRAVLAALYAALAGLGGRVAAPGEFTRRAVLNGKLDLTAAEAVADLVKAETALQREQALRQLGGGLYDVYAGWSERLTRLLAHLEAAIDFADDDLPADVRVKARAEAATLRREIEAHLGDARRGEFLRSGLYVAILGAPNAGKSSLLNRLAQRDVAIVTATPGTTRDVLEVPCDIGGYPVTFADTAGLRETVDAIEAEGVRRAKARAAEAHFNILLFDATAPMDAATLALKNEHSLLVFNKADLAPREGLCISALTGAGMAALLEAVKEKAEAMAGLGEAPQLTQARHRAELEAAAEHLARAEIAAADDMCAEDVRLARRALGRLTGQAGVEDLLDVIFRDFCIGK